VSYANLKIKLNSKTIKKLQKLNILKKKKKTVARATLMAGHPQKVK
jgi:hypothetical protein